MASSSSSSWTRFLLPALLALIFLVHRFLPLSPLFQALNLSAGDERAYHSHASERINQSTLSIFLRIEELKAGRRMPIYFSNRSESTTSPHLLSKEQADSIPFASSHLPYLLQLFSFSPHSDQAKAVRNTLKLCELEPMAGETKFCATSLESMLDSVRANFGTRKTRFKALTTSASSFQNYTILKDPEEILTGKVMSCHTVPYPYLVYFCHTPYGETKLFRVMLGGEGGDGEIVEAAAICHMDTSKWDRDNPSFRVLQIQPGECPVCHFVPRYDIVWAA